MGGITMMCTDDYEGIKRAKAKKVCKNITWDETGRVGYLSLCVWYGEQTQISGFRTWNLFYRHTKYRVLLKSEVKKTLFESMQNR